MKKRIVLHMAVLAILGGPFLSFAQEKEFRLVDFRDQVLAQNQKIQQRKLEHDVALKLTAAEEEGIFEPVFVYSANYTDGERPNSSEQAESQNGGTIYLNKDTVQQAAITGLLESGLQYQFGATFSRLRNNQDGSPFAPVATSIGPDDYVVFTGVELTQPLLRDYGVDVTKAPIKRALLEAEGRELNLRQEVIDIISQTERSYWDLKLAYDQFLVRKQSLATARKLQEDTKGRFDAGIVSDLEVYQAETGVILRETQMAEAEQAYIEAIGGVTVLMSRETREGVVERLLPADTPSGEVPHLDLKRHIQQGLQASPAYLRAQKEREKADLELDLAKNNTKPRLDLTASYGYNGFGNHVQEAWDDLESADFDTWSVGLRLEMPLGGNKRAKRQVEAANIGLDIRQAALADIRVELTNSMQMIIGRIKSLQRRRETLAKVVAFNERLLDTATKRLTQGKGNSRDVLDVEEDLSEARSNELEALTELQKAILLLEAVDGSLLEARRVDVVTLHIK
jgi:outer membrane protein TolC